MLAKYLRQDNITQNYCYQNIFVKETKKYSRPILERDKQVANALDSILTDIDFTSLILFIIMMAMS